MQDIGTQLLERSPIPSRGAPPTTGRVTDVIVNEFVIYSQSSIVHPPFRYQLLDGRVQCLWGYAIDMYVGCFRPQVLTGGRSFWVRPRILFWSSIATVDLDLFVEVVSKDLEILRQLFHVVEISIGNAGAGVGIELTS